MFWCKGCYEWHRGSSRRSLCGECKLLTKLWRSADTRCRHGKYGERGIELLMTWRRFLDGKRAELRDFQRLYPCEEPTLHRLGLHYELHNTRFLTKGQNSGQTSRTLPYKEFLEIWGWITRSYDSDSKIARRFGKSPQTIGRIRNGDTYAEFRRRAQEWIPRGRAVTGDQPIRGLVLDE